ncbi:uncharacterized protein E0L32_005557 [Thyridium curvatum]|uniref:PH domain-containing protein n=1 Tax=Thyridium curvatum TaxID=1093900 RepID=A0A507BBF5_9PEZI|nr:uncharacterized protein E0L32_005557 [Thyridium curvatum]TPX14361.1 hypothetical protein E0L32_005557 [Thyridium curvatum]
MASSEPVHPLRISKNTPVSSGSPVKMASSIPRPLSEISPMEKRRNSPSWNQATKKMTVSSDSSPFQSSPLDGTTSPRLFWQNRGFNENNLYGRSGSPSPTRRSSIERLQKASRVKNSNILALEQKQEYDPTRVPQIERPLAKVQGNAYGGRGINGFRSSGENKGHQRSESMTSIPLYNPARPPHSQTAPSLNAPRTPTTKEPGSPIKSSLSTNRFKSSYDSQQGDGSTIDASMEDPQLPSGRSLHRHAKSVTFDAAPPQINEYEMATPDLSSIGTNSREGSYESEGDEDEYENHYLAGEAHGQEDSFDASLEDTDKTPVVGPDDWRQESPAVHTRGLEDPFEGSPLPDAVPTSTERPPHNRTDSTNSDHRPLPPLPGMQLTRSHSSSSTSATAERMVGAHRSLPSPPPAATSKSEIQNFGNGKMTLEERLKLMMLSDDGKSAAEQQRERRMRRAGTRERVGSSTPEPELPALDPEEQDEAEDTIGDLSGLEEYQLPPRISRESILRRVNGNQGLERESDYNFSSPAPSSPERHLPLDPDVPIPSTEDSMLDVSDISGIGEDGLEKEADLYSITDYYQQPESQQGDINEDAEDVVNDTDSASHYSDASKELGLQADGASTPRATTPVPEEAVPEPSKESDNLLPDLPTRTNKLDLGSGMETFMLPRPNEVESAPKMAEAHAYLQRPYTPEQRMSKPEYDGSGWGEDDEFDEEEPSTPESVIHHPMSDDSPRESPAIPEQMATIKASGSKLKTRPSATPSDIMAMREARRQVSREVPDVPPIPERHRNRLSRDFDIDRDLAASDDFLERHPSFKNRSLTLELDLGLSLDKDFDRVIEAQKVADQPFLSPPQNTNTTSTISRQASLKAGNSFINQELETTTDSTDTNITTRKQRGYLMRQNTKLVAASDKDSEDFRGTRSAGNSPIKKDRPQSWTVEPWNGQRRKSTKKANRMTGPVPPLPGQESNAAPLNSLPEEEPHVDVAPEDSGERGRLFIKVMGVKDLDLPIPKNERTWFALTLDNGVHCVTTAWLELARNAPIGQEFELVVPNDLEFQLTLNVKLEKPAPTKAIQSPTKASRPKTSTFSRVFASPRKRKEMELRQREEEERLAREQREAQARSTNAQPTSWDLLSPLAADDGSFARAYVCLKEHESRCFGRPYSVEVACFNEWATEEAGFASSVKSKRGNTAVVRRAPYKIGKLELQLLFVPRPKGATDEDMPKSMNSCIREMRAAEERLSRNWEGHLSQQGGDCPYWRRRYFKLVGTKLTAYHEATRQPRATINLGNAKRLIDDKRALTEKETTGRNGQRRRSAFAEEEEGYMFVEEGFRIRFNNGEVIDFYADTAQDKEGWMKVLSEVVGRDSAAGDDDASVSRAKGKWCDLVLKREDTIRKRTEGRRVHSRTKSMLT